MRKRVLISQEAKRLKEDRERKDYWRRWGPYLSERQWGTVREDYSANGDAWNYFPHDHARSRVYRWGEDGLGGISDNHQRLCFALSLWNQKDQILKERLFGLTNQQGNHGEDCKENYYYLDSTPTHSYMAFLYKYPQQEFPYEKLEIENRNRTRYDPEYELIDTGIFDENKYFDIFVEYAKATSEDILIKITAINRGPEPAPLILLPTVWFRNTWSWDEQNERPLFKQIKHDDETTTIRCTHSTLGKRWLFCEHASEVIFTENETNYQRLFEIDNQTLFTKDGINDYIVNGKLEAVNPTKKGTKLACHYEFQLNPKESKIIRLRLSDQKVTHSFGSEFEKIFRIRKEEADEFYESFMAQNLTEDLKNIQRQAFAGMLWTKQYYNYIVETWLNGDSKGPTPPEERKTGRNSDWIHMYTADILSMPDKWEYPWFAAWDTAFHLIPLVMIDPDFAKKQLLLLTREWYQHPNGQMPAYEWDFSDVNPPVHAWAAWRIYKIENKMHGYKDSLFLERVFQKLLLNFTWWVNRKDQFGRNIFQGGFLGLDNIGVFDRSGRHLEEDIPFSSLDQADGTAWMGMYCLNMLRIALELAQHNPAYEDIASKFFEHFLYIASAIQKVGLWDEDDGFFYDVIHFPNEEHKSLKVRSMVGLIPLFAVEVFDQTIVNKLPDFKRRMEWFMENRRDLAQNVICQRKGESGRYILSIVQKGQLESILTKLLHENEFLSPYGVRSLSKFHEENPYIFTMSDHQHTVSYEPGESSSGMFGGNSNWRGPIWFPVNFMIIEALQKFHHFFDTSLLVECPTTSGNKMTLWEVSQEISKRLIKIFERNNEGERPLYAKNELVQTDPGRQNYLLFYEYFHGDPGSGIGAS
ncbi:MAG: MGH1-like glycoside hydrolase domain-containing protein, partial [Candidatus Hodarchaeales archaeon]